MRRNLKEAVSKSLVRRTEIAYKARLREISWQEATKSNNYHICSSRVNAADIWRERACTLSVEAKVMKQETSVVARNYRLQEWALMVQDCNNRPKGMTITQWCSEHDIKPAN